MHAVRNGEDDYTIEEAYDDPVGCRWLKLDFIEGDLPFISFLDNEGTTDALRIAYKVGSWYATNPFTNPNITAIDSAVEIGATIVSQNYYFIISLTNGYYTLHNEPGGWNLYPLTTLAGEDPAIDIKAVWNPTKEEFGVLFNLDDEALFLKAEPIANTPTPTNTPSPTPTTGPGTPTNTPVPPTYTPTSIPTSTPTPTYTPTTGPGTPTNTPLPCETLGVTIDMPSDMYLPGSFCSCDVDICNPGPETYPDTPIFVVLDVFGELYFAPAFNDYDYYTEDVTPGLHRINVLPTFAWPAGTGTVSGIYFYAGMTDPAMTELLGTFDSFEFGWSS